MSEDLESEDWDSEVENEEVEYEEEYDYDENHIAEPAPIQLAFALFDRVADREDYVPYPVQNAAADYMRRYFNEATNLLTEAD